MTIATRTKHTFVTSEDQRWVASGGIADLALADSITLDRSAFDLVTAFPNGFIPSGVALGKITATGIYGPYGASPSEVQSLTRTSTGGTITLSFDGSTTAAVAASAAGFTAAVVQAALLLLPTINAGDVVVTGADGGPLTLTFGGRYIGQDVPTVIVDNTSATGGTIVAAVVTAGGGAVTDGREVCAGFLAVTTPMDPLAAATADEPAALYWRGEVVEALLPVGHGLDAAAKADLAAKFRFI